MENYFILSKRNQGNLGILTPIVKNSKLIIGICKYNKVLTLKNNIFA